jgi:hypothetical protein
VCFELDVVQVTARKQVEWAREMVVEFARKEE